MWDSINCITLAAVPPRSVFARRVDIDTSGCLRVDSIILGDKAPSSDRTEALAILKQQSKIIIASYRIACPFFGNDELLLGLLSFDLAKVLVALVVATVSQVQDLARHYGPETSYNGFNLYLLRTRYVTL